MSTVILDTDGVLLGYRDAFNQWLVEKGFVKNLNSWPENQYYVDDYLTVDKRHAKSLITAFNESHHVAKLPSISRAQSAIRRLRERGYILRVVTSFSDHYESMKLRETNLTNVFGLDAFQSITSLPLGQPKTKYLAQYASDDTYYVDDLPRHITEALEAGLPADNVMLMSQPYNFNSDYINYTWQEVISKILGEYY